MERGAYKTGSGRGGGGQVKFNSYEKGRGAGKVLAVLKEGHNMFWVVLIITQELEVLYI